MSLAGRLGVGAGERENKAEAGAAGPSVDRSSMLSDPLTELKDRAQQELYARLGPRLYETDMLSSELETLVIGEIESVLAETPGSLTAVEQNSLVSSIRDDVLGLGPIQRFIDDPTVSEVMVNGSDVVYVERNGVLEKTGVRFTSEQQLRQIIDRIVAPIGRRIDESSPMVDARLEDGSRVNAIISPLAVRGSSVTIRKFPDRALTVDDLIRTGSITHAAAQVLEGCVVGGLNVMVSGGTGTGKTTMLNLLSGFIPASERVVTIEDAVELRLDHENLVSLEARPANSEGVGAVSIRDLVRNSLRMRPDRIVVGECRGGEALDMLQAMNTGHDGSLSTAHANTPRDLLSRLETMVLMSELDLPSRAIRDQIASAIQLIVHLHRMHDGRRVVTSISEVVGLEEEKILLSELFGFDWDAPPFREGLGLGRLKPTGVRPQCEGRLADQGVRFPNSLFAEDD